MTTVDIKHKIRDEVAAISPTTKREDVVFIPLTLRHKFVAENPGYTGTATCASGTRGFISCR